MVTTVETCNDLINNQRDAAFYALYLMVILYEWSHTNPVPTELYTDTARNKQETEW